MVQKLIRHKTTVTEELTQIGQAVEYTSDALGIADLSGSFLYPNRAFLELFGYTRPELAAHGNFLGLFINPNVARDIISSITQKGEWSGEVELAIGSRTWVSLRANAVKNQQGGVIGLVGIYTKLTEGELQSKVQQVLTLNRISQILRSSLDLNRIFSSAVQEIVAVLKVDHAEVLRYRPESKAWINVADCFLASGLLSKLGISMPDQDNPLTQPLKQLKVVRINNIISTSPVWRDPNQPDVGARLLVPLHFQGQVWGSLALSMVDSARLWQDDEVELVSAIARQLSLAIHQDQLDEQVKEQAEQEYLLDAIIQDIHNNLELEEVLTRAVNNLQVVLKADLCAVALCAEEDTECRLVAMTPLPGIPNITGSFLPLVGNLHLQAILAQEDPVSVTGNLFSTLPWSIEPHLSSAAIGVTIRSGKDRYGLLTVQQCRSARTWTPAESRLLKKVAEQLAVAIQHRQMLLKLKHQAAQFESQIQHRTAQLRQALDYEIVLNRIADKMRNSLDEAQILQTAVAELALALAVPSCHAALYNAAKTTATIRYEHREPNFPSRLQQQVQLADYPEFLSTFLTQVPGHLHESARQEHWLLCPMGDDQEFIGHLGLLQLDEAQPWPQLGIRLAQQVANHCFIALRQARLYQASLSHVVELKRLSELKDDFLSTVSHELRTPVTNMRLAIQLLQESLPTQSAPLNKHQHYLEVLGHECQREIKLINDLLAFQKIDGDRAPLVMTEIQLQTWLPCLIAAFEERFREHKQLFKLEIPHGLPTISTEAGSLERILTELLNNAIKYTPARGRILLKVSPKAKHWEFELSNSGAKIPEPELERIFEKFYRIPSNERWQQPGTGLGLALVKNLVGRLEGEVRVQSPTGAVIFTVHLPYALGT